MNFKKISCISLVLASSFFLGACSKAHKPLNGVYVAQNPDNPMDLMFLVFTPKQPNRVALESKDGWSRHDGLFPVKYSQNQVTMSIHKVNLEFKISDDSKTLTCQRCAKAGLPKKYMLKDLDPSVPTDAYNQIGNRSLYSGTTITGTLKYKDAK